MKRHKDGHMVQGKKFFFLLVTGMFLCMPLYVFANFGLDDTARASGLSGYSSSIPVLLGNVVGALLSLIGIVFFVLVVYGGLMWMTAGGNQDTVKKSINTIVSAAIGLIVVLSAYAITNFVFDSVGGGSRSVGIGSGETGGGAWNGGFRSGDPLEVDGADAPTDGGGDPLEVDGADAPTGTDTLISCNCISAADATTEATTVCTDIPISDTDVEADVCNASCTAMGAIVGVVLPGGCETAPDAP